MRYPVLIGCIFLTAVLLCGCTGTAPDDTGAPAATSGPGIVQVDAILDLTGVGSSLGESSQAALLTAQDDINRYYAGIGSPARVQVVIHDAGSDPSTALSLAGQVHAVNRSFVIGYLGSAEVSAIKNYTDANRMIAISSGSTAPSLAIPDDSIYRMISDDTAQGEFMAAYLDSEGVDVVIPVWRGDVWGDSLSNLTGSAFSARGGTALDGVRYDPSTTDYQAAVSSLDVITGEAMAEYGADRVGIYAVTFNEIGDIMGAAAETPNLSMVRWFGSDGNTLDPSLTGNSPAARFASSVNMTGMIWGIPILERDSDVVTRITARLGREPDGSAIALYDTLWVVMEVREETPGGADRDQLARSLVHHLDTYTGASGDLTVNTAGDRELASYNIVEVTRGVSGSEWKNIAQIMKGPSDIREQIVAYPE
ncbi:branched-chain amino acid transport system substrate-binding protein [Methanolinea mesophila]|uniref:ABC transporter substrate-binding protein n=1 Tax=Methanolinea mesophila TaxID=547055 RepID=UPI001AE84802|nr:ABC transporter substrate-binding protein [Methanolinea mesophila]MBP1929828.1 branched-chain amino acid transport system substrate-binding protein [Methanolinea mesophila]